MWWLFVAGAIAFGGLFAAVGLYTERQARALQTHGEPVDVEVVAHHPSRDGDGDVTYKTEFMVVGGNHDGARHTTSMSSNPPIGVVGERGPGYFDPTTGAIASHGSSRTSLRFAMIFSSLGLGIALSGIIFAARAWNV